MTQVRRTTILYVALAVAVCGLGVSRVAARRPAPVTAWRIAAPQLRLPAGQPAGWVLVVHGGGWIASGKEAVATAAPAAAWLNRAGWATDNVDYHPGARGAADVRAAYRALRRRVGPHVKVCALGQSAGAQLVLELAAGRPGLACVIAEGTPADLPALATARTPGSRTVYRAAVAAFGLRGLSTQSPVHFARHIHQPVLAAASARDHAIPARQTTALARLLPKARAMVLAPGRTPFVHDGISPAAARAYARAKLALLRSVA